MDGWGMIKRAFWCLHFPLFVINAVRRPGTQKNGTIRPIWGGGGAGICQQDLGSQDKISHFKLYLYRIAYAHYTRKMTMGGEMLLQFVSFR